MKLEAVQKAMHTAKKGAYYNLDTMRPMKTKKAYSNESLIKVSHQSVRIGIEYDNMKATIQGRADGTKPAENAGLPFGQWYDNGYIVEHKGNYYARFYTTPNKAQTTYLLNGKVIDKEQAKSMCLASEFSNKAPTECFSMNIENITHIG